MNAPGPELLGRLLDQHGAALVLYARQWCSSPEDVVQEALLQLARQGESPREVVAWTYRVVRNGAISAGRRESRRRRHESSSAARSSEWFEESAESALDARSAEAALAQLPAEQREVIVAHLWGGLTFSRIAEVMESSSSTVHRHYQAGLSALRILLGETCLPTSPTNNSPKN